MANEPESKPRFTIPLMAAYGSAHFGISILMEGMLGLLIFCYSTSKEGGRPASLTVLWASAAFAVGRIVDAVVDPIIGAWTDRVRTRWGRRVPFVAFSAVPMCVFFVLLWTPPVVGYSPLNFIYLTVIASLFIIFYSSLTVPYLAWLPDLAKNTAQRTGASTWVALFNILGVACATFGFGLLIDGANLGYQWSAVVLALAALVSFGVTLSVRLHRYEEPGAPQLHRPIKESIGLALSNRHFVRYIAGFALFWVGLRILLYILSYYASNVFGLDKDEAAGAFGEFMGCAVLVSVLTFPTITRLAQKYGKASLFRLGMILFAVFAPLLACVALRPVAGLDGVWQMRILMGLAGIPSGIMFVIPYAILADVIDEDERLVGERREALYFGVQGVFVKASWFLGLGLGTLLLKGFGETDPMGPRMAGPVAGVFALLALLCFRRFDLKPREEQADEGGSLLEDDVADDEAVV